jgi:DNA-directed RNA polymerase subunit RPC12/RpoP
MKNAEIELHDAFYFVCSECGETTFVKAMRIEMSEEDEEQLKEELGISDDQHGCFHSGPTEVTCSKCKAEFQVAD